MGRLGLDYTPCVWEFGGELRANYWWFARFGDQTQASCGT